MALTNSRSFGEILSDIAGNIREIVHGELQLFKAETRENLITLRAGLSFVVIGGLLAALAVAAFQLAAVYALSNVLAPWLAAAIVGAVTAVIAAALVAIGVMLFRKLGLPNTRQSIRENASWTGDQST